MSWLLQIMLQWQLGCMHNFESFFFFFFWLYTQEWVAESYNSSIFSFYGNSMLFFMVAISIYIPTNSISSVQSLSHVQLFETTSTAAHQSSLSITNSRVHPNPCPLIGWCHPTISFSVIPFSSCLQSFLASGPFPMSQLFAGGQSIWVSASASVLPRNIQDRFPLGWTGWTSLLSKELPRVFSKHHSSKSIRSSVLSFLYSPTHTSIHNYWKNHSFD